MAAPACWGASVRAGLPRYGFAAALWISCVDPSSLDVLVVKDALSNTPVTAASVTILGSSLSGITAANGHILFPKVPPGQAKVLARLIGLCQKQADVTMVSGARTHVTISLCGDADHIAVIGNSSGDPAAVLLDAQLDSGASSECANDLILIGPSTAMVPGNAIPNTGTPPCASRAVIFSRSNGAEWAAPGVGLGWTPGMGDEVRVTLPATRTPLPLRVWISLSSGSVADVRDLIRNVHLKTLDDLLLAHRTGIAADWKLPDGSDAIKTVLEAVGGDAAAANALQQAIGKSCLSARTIAALGDIRIYDPEALNVYYVDGVIDPDGTNRYGWYCYQQGIGNILFVEAVGQDAVHMLAHEIGHALGLLEPWDGHALEAIDYTVPEGQNVMGYGLGDHNVFTLGQIFRMSFSSYSWLNAPRAASGTTARDTWRAGLGLPVVTPVRCPCEPRGPSPLECPRSLLDLDRQPPAATTVPMAACTTRGLPASMTLQCGETRMVTATFWDEAGNPDAGARTYWDSDNPGVAIVTLQDDPITTLEKAVAEIRAFKAGTARITVYAGGPGASLSTLVNVPAGACPP